MRCNYSILVCAIAAIAFTASCAPKYAYPPQGYPQQGGAAGANPYAATPSSKAEKLREQAELMNAQLELDKAKLAKEQELANLKAKYEHERQMQDALYAKRRVLEKGAQMLLTPCLKEGSGGGDQWFRGWGTGETEYGDESAAYQEAQNSARADMMTKFVGTVRNIMKQYNSKTGVPSGGISRENNVENALRQVAQKELDGYFETTCNERMMTPEGNIRFYAAGQMPASKAKKIIPKALEVAKVKFNQEKLLDAMDAEFDKMEAKAKEEQKALEEAERKMKDRGSL